MRHKILALAAALFVTLLASGAAAETSPIRNLTPMKCETEGGTKLNLPPGFFLPEPDWYKVDQEVRRLQDAETRLKAENKVLRKPDYLGLKTAAILFVFGVGAGIALTI